MWHRLQSPARRVVFYMSALCREILPYRYWQGRWHRCLAAIRADGVDSETAERIGYYNRLAGHASIEAAPSLRQISRRQSYYYYDLRQFTLAFNQDLRLAYEFGDVTAAPAMPAVVKSRPIAGANENSVLMKLDRLRHFSWPQDPFSFEEKAPQAVWRGALNTEARRRFVRLYADHARHDVGHVSAGFDEAAPKARLSIRQQLQSRYIVSLEGNDVATNLKWIMASNSLCLMPQPRYETWFMEGVLVPGQHYAELRQDLSDLAETVDHFERNPDEARAIIAAAQAHVARFTEPRREELISLLVLQKYFECTGQLTPTLLTDAPRG